MKEKERKRKERKGKERKEKKNETREVHPNIIPNAALTGRLVWFMIS